MPRRVLGVGGGGGVGTVTFSSGGTTANVIPKGTGVANTLADSSITDNGTAISSAEPIRLGNGSASAPSFSFTGDTGAGMYLSGSNVGFSRSGTTRFNIGNGALTVGSDNVFGFTSTSDAFAVADTMFSRSTAATMQLGAADLNGTPVNQTLRAQGAITGTDLPSGTLTILSSLGTGAGASGKIIHSVPSVLTTGTTAQSAQALEQWSGAAAADPNNLTIQYLGSKGEVWERGSNSELLTLSTSGLTTQTSNNLLPANSIIEAVVCRVNTTITTATNWAVGDSTTTSRFSSANATLTSGTTSVGLNHWSGAVTTLAAGPSQAAAAKVQITCTGSNPGAGAVRITVFYRRFVAPSS